uniref:Uncharacterized protein n=1 Tax=Syphacia muris TaxID=451379 RepID=A0A0N5B0H3_9BILA
MTALKCDYNSSRSGTSGDQKKKHRLDEVACCNGKQTGEQTTMLYVCVDETAAAAVAAATATAEAEAEA